MVAELQAPPLSIPADVLRSLPGIVEGHLQSLYQTLSRDVLKTREMLRTVVSEVRLVPLGLGES